MVAKVDYPTGCYDDGHKSFQFDGWLEPHPQTRNKIKLMMRHFGWNRRQRGVSGTYLRKLVVRYSLQPTEDGNFPTQYGSCCVRRGPTYVHGIE